jgi:hypothetical protein
VGNAVAAILTRPRETVNRAVFVHEGITTQDQLIAHAERLIFSSGKGSSPVPTLSITSIDSVSAEKAAWEAFLSNHSRFSGMDAASHILIDLVWP